MADRSLTAALFAQAKDAVQYGVKGMRWGVTKSDRAARREASKEVVTKQKPGRKVKATGGKKLSASEDALRAATHKQKAKASSTDSLSNKELQELVTRMNLENQFSKLSGSGGSKLAEKLLGDLATKGVKTLDDLHTQRARGAAPETVRGVLESKK